MFEGLSTFCCMDPGDRNRNSKEPQKAWTAWRRGEFPIARCIQAEGFWHVGEGIRSGEGYRSGPPTQESFQSLWKFRIDRFVHQSPAFWAPETSFVEDNFFVDCEGVVVLGWFKCISFTVHFISNLMLPLIWQEVQATAWRLGITPVEGLIFWICLFAPLWRHLTCYLLPIIPGDGLSSEDSIAFRLLRTLHRWCCEIPISYQEAYNIWCFAFNDVKIHQWVKVVIAWYLPRKFPHQPFI